MLGRTNSDNGGTVIKGAKLIITSSVAEIIGQTVGLFKADDIESVSSKILRNGRCEFIVTEAGEYKVVCIGTDSKEYRKKKIKISEEQIEAKDIVEIEIEAKLPLVSFTTGTDDEIQKIIEAYYDGTITLDELQTETNSWKVGNIREFDIGGTKYDFVIIGTEHDDLSDGSGKALLTLHSATIYARHAMNSNNTNTDGWSGSEMRSWLQSDTLVKLKSANPLVNNCVKSVTKWTNNKGSNKSDCSATEDEIFLLSEKEIFGVIAYCRQEEFDKAEMKQYEYYKTASNRIKTGAESYWWERSPYSEYYTYFCIVFNDGTVNCYNASASLGVASAFCL